MTRLRLVAAWVVGGVPLFVVAVLAASVAAALLRGYYDARGVDWLVAWAAASAGGSAAGFAAVGLLVRPVMDRLLLWAYPDNDR